MKKVASIILSITMLLFMAAAYADGIDGPVQKPTIRVGINAEYPPFESYEGDKLTGFDIDLMNYIGERIGYGVEFVNMPFDKLIPAVVNGEVDCAISGITITEQRAEVIDCTRAYLTANVIYEGEESVEEYGIVFKNGLADAIYKSSVPNDEEKLYMEVDRAVLNLKKDGTILKLIEKYELNNGINNDERNKTTYSSMVTIEDTQSDGRATPVFLPALVSEAEEIAITVSAPSEWAAKDVNFAYLMGIAERAEYQFASPITREEFCEMIYNLIVAVKKEISAIHPQNFTDTVNRKMLALSGLGIINGKSEIELAPDDYLTREEAATIIDRIFEKGYVKINTGTTAQWIPFSDEKEISDWALFSVQNIYKMGIMNGVGNNNFAPKDTYTTEQAIVTLVRVYERAEAAGAVDNASIGIIGGADGPTSIIVGENINVDAVRAAEFVKVKIPFPDTIEDRNSWLTRARYKDTGEVIPLSMTYDGGVYATVPIQNKDRKLEAFVPEEVNFTDNDDSNSDFHHFRMLSRVGVIRGNDKGEANLYDTITRAEAAAMVMRFIGLENMPEANAVTKFADVNKNDWFYSTVMAAYKCGVVKGDSETTFSPGRDVTREEVTVMIARALQCADLRCSKSEVTNYADEDKISDWAKKAYEHIGQNIVSDYDNTDSVNPVRLLNPQKAATRADVAYILNNTQDDCQLYASELAEIFGFDKEMPVIDGSTSTYPFTQAVYGALFCNGETHPQYPQKHSKSHASYQRLINGEIDMLFASVYPASDILKMAEEKGVELELIPIAYDAMIFFTNKENPIAGLTKEQITDIYVHDAYDNWSEIDGSNALLYPYCRNNDSGSHAQMEKHFLDGNEIHPEVQKETSYTMSNILTDVMDAKTDTPVGYGLGYSIYYYYHNMDMFYNVHENLKLLAIDGVTPTDETIADGSYPLSNNTYVVLRKDTPEDAPARKMAEFMLTEAGQACVENAGYGRLKQIPSIIG